MSAALSAVALQAGFPILQKILSGRLGDANGQLAADINCASPVRDHQSTSRTA